MRRQLEESASPSRFQFSLSTMIWMSILIGVVMWNREVEIRNTILERENSTLRNLTAEKSATTDRIAEHYGETLHVGDPQKVHVRSVRDSVIKHDIDDKIWSWRVALPEGQKYHLYISEGDVMSIPLSAAESVVERPVVGTFCRIDFSLQQHLDGRWLRIIHIADKGRSFTSGLPVYNESAEWLKNSLGCNDEVTGFGKTEVFDSNNPIVLARIRPGPPHHASKKELNSKLGFIVWMVKANDESNQK